MTTPPATVLDDLISNALADFNLAKSTALSMTPEQAAAINEAPGLVSDPVLGPGLPSLEALNLDWMQFFMGNFEVTGHQKILMVQQALDRKRAEGYVARLREFVAVQDPVVFNINQVS